jgi:seryl-tRNA synthetase
MLQLQFLRDNKEDAIEKLKLRGQDFTQEIEDILTLDDKRKHTQQELDAMLAEGNTLSKQIGELFKQGKGAEANELKARTTELKESSHKLKDSMHEVEKQLAEALYHVPNVPNPIVPPGHTDEDNVVVHEEGKIPELHDGAKPHWELADEHDLISWDLGVKITGAGFPVYRNEGARLQRALINFFLDRAHDAGYTEHIPPLVVNADSGYGTGQLPDKEGQMYHVGNEDLYLIPTAEVPLTNIYRDVILKESDFPQKLCGYTPCFRREAGSYGKDVRGLNRLHQFDKVEIVQIDHPSRSYDTLDTMVNHVKSLLIDLRLPFRILRLCGGDLGFTSAITYDFEVYSAAQGRWLEVSSVSNFETYQANRLKCRYKGDDGKTHLAHTLNGSALALPRIMAAILENRQTPNGIEVPHILIPYTGFDKIGG